MSNSNYIELQGFLSSNKVSYKKVVKMLIEFLENKVKVDDVCLFFDKLELTSGKENKSMKEVINDVRANGTEYPIIMDYLMDIVDEKVKKKKFSIFLDEYSKKMNKKNQKLA